MPKQDQATITYNRFFDVPGEMAELIKNYPWETTSLGAPSTWSSSLLTTIGLILRSNSPMLLWWGDELIQFYNDAYKASFGKNQMYPDSLGQKAEICFAEYWKVIQPKIEATRRGNGSVSVEDELIPIKRNGNVEKLYWSYSFNQVLDIDGGNGGVLAFVRETTEKVVDSEKINSTLKKLADSEKRLRYLLQDAPVPMAILTGPDLIIETINFQMLNALQKKIEQAVGRKLIDVMPNFVDQGIVGILQNVFSSGNMYYGNEVRLYVESFEGQIIEFYASFVFQPIKDEDGKTTSIMVVGNIITELVLARMKAEQAEELLRISVEAANVGTWTMNLSTKKLIASDRLKELFGFEASTEVSFEDLLTKVPPGIDKVIKNKIKHSARTGEDYISEHQILMLPNHSERWVRALGKIYTDGISNTKQFTGLMIDVTEQKIEDRRKNDFIGMVSHELKTPITSLSAYLQILHAKSLTENNLLLSEILNKANQQVRKMNNLISGFLSVSRLESGKFEMFKTEMNLSKLVDDVIDEIILTSSTHKIEKIFSPSIMIYADYDKIFSVMVNLLNNAVKYSKNATLITIQIKSLPNEIMISVKDSGMGIHKQDHRKLFDRYYRSESNIIKHISGFGIGLYLSAEIIHAHQGKIWVQSQLGKGSTFFVTLPKN